MRRVWALAGARHAATAATVSAVRSPPRTFATTPRRLQTSLVEGPTTPSPPQHPQKQQQPAPANATTSQLQAIAQYTHAFAAVEGRRPRILLCSFDDDTAERRDDHFAISMADVGFDVDISPTRQSPAQVARQAVEADVHGIHVGVRTPAGAAALPRLLECLQQNAMDDVFVTATATSALEPVPAGVVCVRGDDFMSAAETIVRLLQESPAA